MTATTLPMLLNQHRITVFLLDASGVLYNDTGPVPGIQETVRHLQSIGQVFVVTNNTSHYITNIAERLHEVGIMIPSENIISSGLGITFDPALKTQITGKTVYVFGRAQSHLYLRDIPVKGTTSRIEEADVILMMASLQDATDPLLDELKHHLRHTPRPVICTNPDRYVLGKNGHRLPVIGYYTEKLEAELGISAYWFGKPYHNFSVMLKTILTRKCPDISWNSTFFFDDNPDNVIALKQHIGVNGCWVTGTGLGKTMDITAVLKEKGMWLDYAIPAVSINHIK